MKDFSVVRRFPNLIVFIIILLSTGVFGQSNSAFGTLSAAAEKNKSTEITRPRLITTITSAQIGASTQNTTTVSTDKPTTKLTPSSAQSAKLEQTVFEILNQKRVEMGLPKLNWSEDMAKIARLHSNNMAELNFFSHLGKDGSLVNDRADSLGISNWRALGENIAYNQGFDNPAEFACERWLLSQGHRNNILNKLWKEAGVGVAITGDGTFYFTQVFAQR